MWPDWPVPLVNRAMCHKKMGKWDAVERDSRKALEFGGNTMKAHYLLGVALRERHESAEAAGHLTKVSSFSP